MDGEFGRIVSVRVFVAAWIAIWSGCVCLDEDFGNFPVAISAPPVVAVARHVQCHFVCVRCFQGYRRFASRLYSCFLLRWNCCEEDRDEELEGL